MTTEGNTHNMFKKSVITLMLVLALTSTASVANAEVELPECYPCDETK